METLQDKLTDLQWLILSRFRKILRNPENSGFRHRYLKAGIFRKKPVSIYEADIAGLGRYCVLTADEIAHLLSVSQWDYSDIVKHIIIYPAFETSEEKILTHAYDSAEKILIFYLYPSDWNFPQKSITPDRFSYVPAAVTPGLTDIILRSLHTAQSAASDKPVIFTSELFMVSDEDLQKLTCASDEFHKTQYEK